LGGYKNIQGFQGLLKTLRLEYPGLIFRSVISNTLFDAQILPEIVLNELTVEEAFSEIEYVGKDRFQPSIRLEDIVKTGTPHLKLDKDSVVLVLGGAQGISPELISQLSVEYPCRYILLGRSEPLSDETGVYASLKTKVDIRKHLIAKEQMKVPIEIEKKIQKIFKSNQIAETIAKIQASGAKVTYKSIDITDAVAFRNFLKSVREEYGKIDGIIQSAGLLHDKLFADKTWESFKQVYDTKINPLHVILEELQDDLKLLVMFSSVASTYGNRGQSDYTSANSVFDLVASSLPNLKPDLRVLAVNWGPWKGAGMVSDSMEAEFAKRGVSLIPLKEGGAYFVNELKYGTASRTLVMGGKEEVENFLKTLN
jgi:NAD(P)-dependent dehydrogenase (short-subunit alcohol dehydrogenase family)